MTARLTRQLLIDRRDRAGRRLQAQVQRRRERGKPVAKLERLVQAREVAIGVEALRLGPAQHGGVVCQEVGRRRDAALRGVDEIQPDRVAQQGEL